MTRDSSNDTARKGAGNRAGGRPPVDADRAARLWSGGDPTVGANGVALGLGPGRGHDPAGCICQPDRVRDVLHDFNHDGFDSLHPHYAGARPPRFTENQREQPRAIAMGRPADSGLPFSIWNLSKLADHLMEQEVVDKIPP